MRGFRFLDRSLSIDLCRSLRLPPPPQHTLDRSNPLSSHLDPSNLSTPTPPLHLAPLSPPLLPPSLSIIILRSCRGADQHSHLYLPHMSDKTLDRPKRSQVRIACTACRTSKAGCSDQRPCTRCSSLNIQCVDAPRRRPRGSKLIELERVVKKLMAHVRTVGRPATSFLPSIVTLVIIVAVLGVAHRRANGAIFMGNRCSSCRCRCDVSKSMLRGRHRLPQRIARARRHMHQFAATQSRSCIVDRLLLQPIDVVVVLAVDMHHRANLFTPRSMSLDPSFIIHHSFIHHSFIHHSFCLCLSFYFYLSLVRMIAGVGCRTSA